jgi:hypothetical protein
LASVAFTGIAFEGLVQQRLFQRFHCGELALIEGFEALGLFD